MSTFPTNAELEAAIVQHADEDTPRLAYADWLDENGDPDRAAFIRVQCRLAEMPPDDADWYELLEQEHNLSTRLHDRFTSLRPKLPERASIGILSFERIARFRRGFPFSVDYEGRGWTYAQTERAVDDLAEIAATTTIRGLWPSNIPPARLTELIESPAFAAFRALKIQFTGGSTWQDDFEATAFQRLSETPIGEHLNSLELLDNPSDKGLRSLAAAKSFESLRHLTLVCFSGDTTSWSNLASAKMLRGLAHLVLASPDPEIADAISSGLSELPHLHTLELQNATAEAVSNLTAGAFPRLVRFEVSARKLTSSEFQTLLDREWFGRLQYLDLAGTNLGDRAISNLTAHPVAPNLRELRLGNHKLGVKGLMALARPGRLSNIKKLDLSLFAGKKSALTDTDLASFLSSLQLPRLRQLKLYGLPLGDVGAKAIAMNPAFAELRTLFLGDGVTESGMSALKTASHLQRTLIV